MALNMSELYSDPNPEEKGPKRKKKKKRKPDAGSSESVSIYSAALTGKPSSNGKKSSRGDEEAEPKRKRKRKRRQRRKEGEAKRAKQESSRLLESKQTELDPDGEYGGEFAVFDLSAPVLKAIDDMGWTAPSEIQERVIPLALTGRDVVGQARTGSGKTGAFVVPALEMFHERGEQDEKGRPPASLILTPTRELALQIHRQMKLLAAYTHVRTVPVYGGAPMEPQLRALRRGVDIVVGTPGRVMDHIRRGTLKTDHITCFILDEADRMFDLGFRDDIYWVSRRLPDKGRQTLLLSATMPREIVRLAEEVTRDPELIYTATENPTVKTVEQFYVSVDPERKLDLLVKLVSEENPEKGMVFTRTKRAADKIAEKLRRRGLDAGEIHGDLRQRKREAILERFREGNLDLLVATDVASRGLDIQGVTHVVNYDIPEDSEDYIHRIGRTARMGKTGRAFTFVTPAEGKWLSGIEKLINLEVPQYKVEGFRCRATAEEAAAREGNKARASSHPMASKLSPALLNILNNRRGGGRGRGGGGGGGRGGGGRGGGGRGGGGRGGGNRGRGRGGGGGRSSRRGR